MVSVLVLTFAPLFCFISSVKLVNPLSLNFEETPPKLLLKSYSNFALDRKSVENSSHVRLPRVFDELVFECNSTLPTKWNFYAEQLLDPSVKKIEIKKWFETRNLLKQSPRFFSTFRVKYSNPCKLVNLSCENICPGNYKNCQNLNQYVTYSTNPETPAYFILEYGSGNKSIRQKEKALRKDDRLGYNVHCKYALHVDFETGNYACTEADNIEKEVPTIFVPCSNPDECGTVFKQEGENCTNTFPTFYQNCTSKFCAKLRDTSELFVLACGENSINSVAKAFFKPLKNGTQKINSSLYEYKKHFKPSADMGIMIVQMNSSGGERCGCKYLNNDTLIYTKYSREIFCSALTSFFSFGIRWVMRYENGTEKYLGNGAESMDETTQTFTSRKTILFHSTSIKSVVCIAPIWNSVEVTNFTFPVIVKESVMPSLSEYELLNTSNSECHNNRKVDIYITHEDKTLTCRRSGEPPAEIKWTFDGVKPDIPRTASTHYTRSDSMTESNVTLRADHPFSEVVCIVNNAAGMETVKFSFIRDRESNVSMNNPIVIGVCSSAGLLLIIVVIVASWRIRKQAKQLELTEEEVQEFQNGNPDACDAFLVPYNMELEVSTDNFTTSEEILGSGAYGKVVKGVYATSVVAIKTLKKTADVGYLKALLSELKIMSFVGPHPNVVNLLGACTQNIKKREIFIILEYCELGDMVSLLQKNRGIFHNYFEIQYADNDKNGILYQNQAVKRLNTMDLIRWSAEIALGMDFLSAKNVIHGDLAGRNILITKCLHAKVSDFGLAKQLYDYTTYVQKVNVPLPLRWMAYESLKDLKFSVQSDIWSYGVVMWEIFSLGETPYPGMEWGFGSWRDILNGTRNEMPPYASDKLYKLMWNCWNIDPKSRPSFEHLWRFLFDYSNSLNELYEM